MSGGGDEHHVLTTAGGQLMRPARQAGGAGGGGYPPGKPPKITSVLNEYMGVCMEEHCAIGRETFSLINFSVCLMVQRSVFVHKSSPLRLVLYENSTVWHTVLCCAVLDGVPTACCRYGTQDAIASSSQSDSTVIAEGRAGRDDISTPFLSPPSSDGDIIHTRTHTLEIQKKSVNPHPPPSFFHFFFVCVYFLWENNGRGRKGVEKKEEIEKKGGEMEKRERGKGVEKTPG